MKPAASTSPTDPVSPREDSSHGLDDRIRRIMDAAIPDWTTVRFAFLEPSPRWAPAVQTELTRQLRSRPDIRLKESARSLSVRCDSHVSGRELHRTLQTDVCRGIVLVMEDQGRDILLLLGRLSRLCRPAPPVLVLIPPAARSLLPVLFESGAGSVMVRPVPDQKIAAWCLRVLQMQERPADAGAETKADRTIRSAADVPAERS